MGKETQMQTKAQKSNPFRGHVAATWLASAILSLLTGVLLPETAEAQTTCDPPNLSGRQQIWTATLTVGLSSQFGGAVLSYGYSANHSGSNLSDTTFQIGTTEYTVASIAVGGAGAFSQDLSFNSGADLRQAANGNLRLHVCDEHVNFSDARWGTRIDVGQSNIWGTTLDWSSETTRTLYLSIPRTNTPATGMPTITC